MKDYIKYLATLCEGENLLKEHEHYYDTETGYSYDDEGNRWRGAPNPKYDVSGYWPHTGRNAWWKGGGYRYGGRRSYGSTKKTFQPKEIEKDKLYFGREAKTDSSLIYFMFQCAGLISGSNKVPSGVEERSEEQLREDMKNLASAYLKKDVKDLGSLQPKELRQKIVKYFKMEKGSRDDSEVRSYLESTLKFD